MTYRVDDYSTLVKPEFEMLFCIDKPTVRKIIE